MAHVTLSIPDEVYKNMKRHPEIKWSELVRQSIISYLREMEGTSSSKEIYNSLSQNAKDTLWALGSKKAATHYRRMRNKEWKRAQSLTQIS
jgi:hypothetical protein